ncbi:nitrogenase iron-molybdenum cofactor biosynthesis protein NifN [Nodularia spumigena CS-584]|jgi:nitrogenase molybdenum-iron protein NifN|uniref:Nitrogenase iron-molybdenum cofactor biosynthesis protein NifN n=2 Tax=Nodularia spumigena TaxID=70799 RepID=A0A2S0Q9P3_NODSP|nr:nitrogenase iron-molybdenum cofactor biosynthesis protein NifN [Nodularia spumigena]AHJ30383.1 Nitrogenase FeMo-cofactor scaffold and assembly protein NifN [Nodularia spumigena CCY9414]AVZ31395.1 nitrogenase molybdenum-iron protein NifN [Nodularia spumigena UHCC 0039]EAW47001.1 nitrogenase olybdenum-iron protein [Nodularia spumigena CCY9414]MDB9383460.1 nitrogenase iron-molybdenum cofactor biosynthesis protein NifN [Nodularia spumigena CS-584]MEA5526119.1 nitrogenase iron-molybdenum cofacto
MAIVNLPNKPLTVNPLKQSQALGASLAFLGLKGMIPLFHGSQGCTAFAKVVLVRHFREAIPLATTAMTEVSTILGGEENVEQAILTLVEKVQPEIIGLCSTGLTETRGDELERFLKDIRDRHPELDYLPIVFAPTPDFKGALQDGFAAAVESIVREIPKAGGIRTEQVTILAGSSLTPGDLQEIKEMVTAFGLVPIIVPDIGASLDGHLEDGYSAVTASGTTIKQLRDIGSSAFTIALGESMRNAAKILEERFNIPYEVFGELTGLDAVDEFLQALAILSSNSVPEKYRRQRRQLQDAMLDSHFYFGAKRVSLALEPDLLWSTVNFLQSMGTQIHAVVTTTRSPLLEKLPVKSVTIGDLDDFEQLAAGSDLLIGNSNVGAIAKRLSMPFYRLGIPIYDRLGNGYFTKVGYRGTMELLFGIGNLFLEAEEERVKQLWEIGSGE